MLSSKICGISDIVTLKYILLHNYPPKFVGMIMNYQKSPRFINIEKAKELTNINSNHVDYCAVLVDPSDQILTQIKDLNFSTYQIYDQSPEQIKKIKDKYNKKIITAITIKKAKDVKKYKDYQNISDIILFDSKGYEKSMSFDHVVLKNIPNSINRMIAGNIKYSEKLDKYSKVADIIDISGGLETSGKKDLSKIDIFLKNINKFNNEN